MVQYNKVNIRSLGMLINVILTIALTVILYWVSLHTKIAFFLIFCLPWTIFVCLALLYSLTSKVILTQNEIIVKTPFTTRTLKYSEIKTIGTITTSRGYPVKSIYLSKKPNDMVHMDFHYNQELYDILEKQIKNQPLT